MTRVRLFAKANSDVADALFGCTDMHGHWGGLNQHFRESGLPHRMRLFHETAIGSQALLAARGEVPEALCGLGMVATYSLASQFSTRVFDVAADAVVLSLQGDINVKLMRHKASGALFYPAALERPDAQTKAWLRAECEPVPPRPVAEAVADLGQVIDRIQAVWPAHPVLVFNLSEIVPGDRTFSFCGVEDSLARRIKQFNLAAMELTRRPGVALVDVNRILAERGALALKLDAVRVTSAGSALIAAEVARLLAKLGVIEPQGRDVGGS